MARLSAGLLSLLGVSFLTATVGAQQFCACHRPTTAESKAFFNQYQPGVCGCHTGALPAPYPTPAVVGHVYYTYQPFMPNEWLYKHHRGYHQSYDCGRGLKRTKVAWHGTKVRTDLHKIRKFFTIAR